MQTDSWGPPAWETLHFMAFGSPERLDQQDITNYTHFVNDLQCILPCSLCRSAYKQLLLYIKIDEYIDTRDGLCYWTFLIHNLVNRKLGKSLEKFDNVIYKYENMRARCGRKDNIEEYEKCKASLQEFTMYEATEKARTICRKYKDISHRQLESYYISDKNLDPKFQKCSV